MSDLRGCSPHSHSGEPVEQTYLTLSLDRPYLLSLGNREVLALAPSFTNTLIPEDCVFQCRRMSRPRGTPSFEALFLRIFATRFGKSGCVGSPAGCRYNCFDALQFASQAAQEASTKLSGRNKNAVMRDLYLPTGRFKSVKLPSRMTKWAIIHRCIRLRVVSASYTYMSCPFS